MESQSISFAGIQEIIAAEFTLSRGVSPSICTLFIRPQSVLNIGRGPLSLGFGSSTVTFTDMTPDLAHIRPLSGTKWALQLYDRRFYWKGHVVGEYNQRQPDGKVKNEANSQLLADKLLKALGETTHDVSRMSQIIYPHVKWDGNPAYALASLLDDCSCTLAPGPTNNLVVYPLGQGNDLPNGDDTVPYLSYKRQVPGEIKVVCGPDLFQSKFKLEAVARGFDEKIQPIDNVDFLPTGGWGNDFYMFFPAVASNRRLHAFESMYRLYRVQELAQGGMTPTGCQTPVTRFTQYALNDFSCTMYEDPTMLASEGKLGGLPSLDGTYWPQSDHAVNTAVNTPYIGKFAINKDNLVLTDYPIIKFSSSGSIQAPELYLTTSFAVWDDKFEDRARYTKSQNLGGVGTVVVRRQDLYRVFNTAYSGTNPTGTTDNQPAISAQVDEYLRLHALKWQDPWILDREYHGILPLLPDGKIAQVRWRIGFDGPTTRASKNFEFDTCNVSYEERRRRETVAQLQEAL